MNSAGPINWDWVGPDGRELVMGVFLLRENGQARLRKPSSGDGGVDVFEPVDGGYRVTQVKGFTGRLGDSQKKQIAASYEAVVDDPRLDKPVVEWVLSMPTSLTSGEDDWLRNLLAEAPFTWRVDDVLRWTSLASRYPEVVDFYLNGGRDRVRRQERQLRDLLDEGGAMAPVHISKKLERLRESVNADSPHYRFEFRTSAAPPSPHDEPHREGLVFSETVGSEGGGSLTWDVFARFPQAPLIEPIVGRLGFVPKDQAGAFDISAELQDFFDFGAPVELPEGALKVFEFDAPGGLGYSKPEGLVGSGWIGPAKKTNNTMVHRLQVVDSDDAVVAELVVPMRVTGGRAGAMVVGEDAASVLRATIRIPRDPNANYESGIEYLSMDGKRAVDVLPAAEFLGAMGKHSEVVIRPELGPDVLGRATVQAPYWEPFVPIAAVVRSLVFLQGFAGEPLIVPEHMSEEDVLSIRRAHVLLRGGELRQTWIAVEVAANKELKGRSMTQDDVGKVLTVGAQGDLTFTLGGETYVVGRYHRFIESAQVEHVEQAMARLVPGGHNIVVTRLGDVPLGAVGVIIDQTTTQEDSAGP